MADTKNESTEFKMNRCSGDRRVSDDRRQKDVPVDEERRQGNRRKVQRRRQIDPTTCERDYSNDEIEFMQALDEYKRRNGRMFPTCSEILEVIRSLGYVKTDSTTDADDSPLQVTHIEADDSAAKITDESVDDEDGQLKLKD